ncbi:protein PHLOEM PROTEIN 2-LIKE A1-like [Salvia miltiorrhiza]|uniref:protein PHLOEM PROTEIN 2-LIKE A1-like n=1 Tax=Salvia miltiorrhiza TaxID=226208 RepID=UPI0025AC2D9E|nr:protein PHLOEM PROTEIN 2-LIKE A1-like [Salvia miltiorrhiza]
MGAGSSQDQELEPNGEELSKNGKQSKKGEAKANQSSKRVSLPHNCEDILKHAASPVDISATNIQEVLYTGVYLNQKRKKYWVDKQSNCNCFMIFAQSLSITWAEDQRFWHWPLLKESSDEHLAAAELLDVCWLEVHGRFEIENLSPGRLYEVVFVVMLKDPAYGWEVPVNLRLTLPNGTRQEHKENMMEKPRGIWIDIPAGEIKSSAEKTGEMEFSLYEYGAEWKRGLLIKGVKIQPKA